MPRYLAASPVLDGMMPSLKTRSNELRRTNSPIQQRAFTFLDLITCTIRRYFGALATSALDSSAPAPSINGEFMKETSGALMHANAPDLHRKFPYQRRMGCT